MVRTQRDTVGILNPSFERLGADFSISECWERVVYESNTGSFARIGTGHSGSASEQIEITTLTSGNRKLLLDRARPECQPGPVPGQAYRLSAWYELTASDGSSGNVRLVIYDRSAAGVRTFLGNSGGYGAGATWKRMVWGTPPIPADATAVTVGVTLSSPGLLTVDDVLMSRL